MSSLFLKVLNMSITASFAALVVMILRLLFKKIPKIFSYALWAVVLFRLICPFSLESALSLIPNNTEYIPQQIIHTHNPSIDTNIKLIDSIVNKPIDTSIPPVNHISSVNPLGVMAEIGALIWMLGIIALLGYGIITYIKLRLKLTTATLVRSNIYETDRIKTAFVIGFLKPRIIIPINISEAELSYIIKHEETHIKRLDYIIKPLAFLALTIHWFNPIIWLSYCLMVKDMEMSCDESVMKNTSEDIRAKYSNSLLNVSAKQSRLLSPLAFGEGNVKSRINNILNYKKPSFWVVILVIIILIFVLISFGTNSKNDLNRSEINSTENENNAVDNDRIIYKNNTLGFTLMFPEEWKDKYVIEESKEYISVFNKKIYDKNHGGLLFTINRTVGELITQEDMDMEPVPTKIILQGNGYTYSYRLPSDVQYPMDDEELIKEYEEMWEQTDDAVSRMSLLGENRPKAANEGFKVIGSSFFTTEIPIEWVIKPYEDYPIWEIYKGENKVGSIRMEPYEAVKTDNENSSNNELREYLYSDEWLLKMNITLYQPYADKNIMNKIKDSFTFIGGPYNIINMQSTANMYIAGGGKKVFGTIEGFEIIDGKPVAVKVNVMKFIPDGPNDNNPNGYNIEDLNYIETYSLDFGVNVAALVPPNYTSYKMYYMMRLDESFIKNYDYKNLYYDFIIGSDGQLKIVLGHYIA